MPDTHIYSHKDLVRINIIVPKRKYQLKEIEFHAQCKFGTSKKNSDKIFLSLKSRFFSDNLPSFFDSISHIVGT